MDRRGLDFARQVEADGQVAQRRHVQVDRVGQHRRSGRHRDRGRAAEGQHAVAAGHDVGAGLAQRDVGGADAQRRAAELVRHADAHLRTADAGMHNQAQGLVGEGLGLRRQRWTGGRSAPGADPLLACVPQALVGVGTQRQGQAGQRQRAGGQQAAQPRGRSRRRMNGVGQEQRLHLHVCSSLLGSPPAGGTPNLTSPTVANKVRATSNIAQSRSLRRKPMSQGNFIEAAK